MPDLHTGLWTISTSTVDVFALSLIAEAVSQSSNSRKNQIYKAFREVGRVMRTVALLRFLADSGLRARVTAATNKAEAYNGFSAWTPVRQPGRDRRERPGRAGKSVKWNSPLCNLICVPHRDRHDGGHPAAGCRGVAGDR